MRSWNRRLTSRPASVEPVSWPKTCREARAYTGGGGDAGGEDAGCMSKIVRPLAASINEKVATADPRLTLRHGIISTRLAAEPTSGERRSREPPVRG